MRRLIPFLVITLGAVGADTVSAQPIGDKVVITKATTLYTELQQEHHIVAAMPVSAGTVLTVRDDGKTGWYLVGANSFANGVEGWVDALYCVSVDAAIPHFTEVIRRAPQNAEGYNARGNVWFAKGDDKLAIGDFSQAIARQPKNAEYLSNRGRAYTSHGDYGPAVQDLNAALEAGGMSAEVLTRRGDAWLMSGELDKALADFNAALNLDSTNSIAFCHRGIALVEQKNYAAGIASLEDAVRNNPRLAFAYSHLAWTLAACPDVQFNDGPKAVKYAKAACTLNGWRRWNDFGTLGAAYAAAGDFERALDYQSRAMQVAPRRSDREEARQRIEMYKRGQPYRFGQSPPPAPPAPAPGAAEAPKPAPVRETAAAGLAAAHAS